MGSAAEAKELIEKVISCLANGDCQGAGQYLGDEIVHNFSRSGREVNDMSTRAQVVAKAANTGPVKITLLDSFANADGSKVAAKFSFPVNGSVVPGGDASKTVEVTGQAIARIENGKAVEVSYEQNTLGLLLGVGLSVQ